MKLFCSLLALLICIQSVSTSQDPLSDKDHFKAGEHDSNFDHEAFLGKDQAAEFKDLSPEKSKEKLAKLIPKIDKNGDAEITEEELKNHINFMQRRFVENDVKRTWKQFDPKEFVDEKLGWKHYRERVYGPEGGDLADEYKKMVERDKRRWKKADLDGDEMMTTVEYACFMHPEDCEHMKEIVVTETTEDIDKDKDGFVTVEEYISDMYRPADYPDLPAGKEPDWVASEREMFTDHRDKNKDGKLDMSEMKEWITPTGFDHAQAEAHHLIHMADDDKDGKLSLDEALAHYDVFVGSQATDYGEQLQKHDPSEL